MADVLPDLERYYDRLSLDENREQLRANLIATKHVTLMEGWIPAEEETAACKVLERHGCAYEMTDPVYDEEDESTQPPVAFKNNRFVSRFSALSPNSTGCRNTPVSLIPTPLSRHFSYCSLGS